MPKKQAPTIFSGSLKTNFWQYITKYHMAINLKDYHAARFLHGEKRKFDLKRNKKLNPAFEYTVEYITGKDNHSYAKINWMTGTEQLYYLHNAPDAGDQMYAHMKSINKMAGYQRDWEGNDDEPEDEEAVFL